MATTIQVRRGTASQWTSASPSPTLAAGEIGYETDTGKYKIGTGSATWATLKYAAVTPDATTGKVNISGTTGPTATTVAPINISATSSAITSYTIGDLSVYGATPSTSADLYFVSSTSGTKKIAYADSSNITGIAASNITAGTITPDRLTTYALSPTLWYGATSPTYSAVTATSATAYSILNQTQGVQVSPSTTYKFEMYFSGLVATATTKSVSFTLNGTSIGTVALNSASSLGPATATTATNIAINTTAATTITASTTGTSLLGTITGTIRTGITATQYINPQITISAGTSIPLTINAGAYMSLIPLGTDVTASQGTWA
jgi:hypothetical protein